MNSKALINLNKSVSPATLPPEVLDNGGNPASIDNYDGFLQFLMQAAANANLVKIRKLAEDQESEGIVAGYDITATETVFELTLDRPSQSVTLINTSAPPVTVWINYRGIAPRVVRQNVPLAIDFGSHKLRKIFLQCAPGATALVEIVIKR